MRVGLYGGTFDPIHNGHLHVIRELIERKVADKVMVLPAGEPRLREHSPIASGPQRRTMCQLAIKTLPAEIASHVEVNPIEILREGPSYTIDTVEAVAQAYEGDEIVLILGTDAYEKLDQWHRIEDLKKLVTFCVIDRPDFPGTANLDIDTLKVSATEVRNSLSTLDHSTLDQLVPAPVAAYIKEQNLYVR